MTMTVHEILSEVSDEHDYKVFVNTNGDFFEIDELEWHRSEGYVLIKIGHETDPSTND